MVVVVVLHVEGRLQGMEAAFVASCDVKVSVLVTAVRRQTVSLVLVVIIIIRMPSVVDLVLTSVVSQQFELVVAALGRKSVSASAAAAASVAHSRVESRAPFFVSNIAY